VPLCNIVDQSVSLIKQVLSDARKIDEGFDAEALKEASIADPGELQKLRTLKRAWRRGNNKRIKNQNQNRPLRWTGAKIEKKGDGAPADKMTSLFAFTLYFFPPDTNSTASATRGVFLFWVPVPATVLNKTLVASAPVSTTKFFRSAFGSKYPVSEEDRVPDRGSTARAGVKKPVALPVSCKSERRVD
jgi:hypothetical protein